MAALDWPTLSLQWTPSVISPSKTYGPGFSTYQLLIGTHTGKRASEYLKFVGIDIPTEPIVGPVLTSSGPKVNTIYQIPHTVSSSQKQDFFSEVNVARYNPFDSSSIASIMNTGDVVIYNTSTGQAGIDSIQSGSILKYHTKSGYAMDWNTKIPGILATGSEDSKIAIWDVNSSTATSTGPKYTLSSTHSANVTSVKWSPHLPTVLASTSEDGTMIISDTRSTDFSIPIFKVEHAQQYFDTSNQSAESDKEPSPATAAVVSNGSGNQKPVSASPTIPGTTKTPLSTTAAWSNTLSSSSSSATIDTTGINDVSFNPFNEYLLATGCADKTAALWDLRYMNQSIYSLIGHSASVTGVQWSPHTESVVATAGYDRRIMIWDLSRSNSSGSGGISGGDEEEEDGPPELLFVHGGHTSKISCFEWHPTLPWVIASAGEDNIIHVWKPAQAIVKEEEDEEEEEGEEGGDDEEMEDS